MSKFGSIADDIAESRNEILAHAEKIGDKQMEPEIALTRAVCRGLDGLWTYLEGQGFGGFEIAKGFVQTLTSRIAYQTDAEEKFKAFQAYEAEVLHDVAASRQGGRL